MAIDRLYEEIKQLPPELKEELYKRLNVKPKEKRALDDLIGIAEGPENKGAQTYKEDLYGGPQPL
ncbi:MAG: hypothetical protein AB1510_13350 [Bacillota bacterium]